MRMGISVCGYLEATEEQRSWLPECALYMDQLDIECVVWGRVCAVANEVTTGIRLRTAGLARSSCAL